MLKILQQEISMIHKFDVEIELVIEDEDELANELEQQTEFHVSANVTIARFSALNEKKNVIDLHVSFQRTFLHHISLHRVE